MSQSLEALRALGLTEYGARAYAALVALGPATAADAARAGPLPRTKVYAVLSELVKRGWVDVESGRPKRYRARQPRDCFDRERARWSATIDAALPEFEAQYRDRSRRFAGPLWLLEGAEMVAARSLEMVSGARVEILLVAPFALPGDERALARAMRDAVRRGVRVRVGALDLDAPHVQAFARAGAEVRITLLPPRLLAVDARQALIAFPQVREDGTMDVKAVWNPAPELMSLVGTLLASVWNAAEPISAAPARRVRVSRRGTLRRS